MSKKLVLFAFLTALCTHLPARGQVVDTLPDRALCSSGRVMVPQLALPNNSRLIVRTKPTDAHECDAVILSELNAVVYTFSDHSISLNAATGLGVTSDGAPAAVLTGYSGGNHCCTSAAIVALGSKPGLVWQFDVWAGMYPDKPPADLIPLEDESFFRDTARNRVAILVADNFSRDAGLPFTYGAYVLTAFELSGGGFTDVSRDLIPYRANADQARGRLAPAALAMFLSFDPSRDACYDRDPPEGCPAAMPDRSDQYWDTKQTILFVLLDDLHSGDLDQVQKDLDAFWPAADRARMQGLLLHDYCHANPRAWFHLSAPAECMGVR